MNVVLPADVAAYLSDTARDVRLKLQGMTHRLEIVEGGVDIHVSFDGLANRQFCSWAELEQSLGVLPLRVGMCAGELAKLRQTRDAWRKHDAETAALNKQIYDEREATP